MSTNINKLDREWSEAERTKVQVCLDKVLSSPVFSHAARQQRFLSFVVTQTLTGNTERLKGYTIGVEVFDREPTFDPTVDAIVRVEAARLRVKLREYYEVGGRSDPVRFELPKGAYAVHIELQVSQSSQSPFLTREPHGTTAGAAHGVAPSVTPFVHPIEDKPSIAVLPFANMSSDSEQEYFADGITDILITELSKLSGLFVISRHSSFVYKGLSKRAEEIAKELGVRYLLEGSVQRSGMQVRITAQLVDNKTGSHLWAEHYDRELKEIFAVQDDVTRRIVAALKVKLAGDEAERFGHQGPANIEAHDVLLRGLERFWVYTRESAEEAQILFAKAIELDPRYAFAHAWLARTLAFKWIFFWDPSAEILERAFEHARMAVNLDPQMPFANSVLGWVQLWRKQEEASVAAGWRAVALDPNNADAHLFLSMTLVAAARGEEALHCIEKGMRLNPHPSAFYQLAQGLCYFVLEDYDKAIAAFKRGIELTDAFIPNHFWLYLTYTLLDREEGARFEREKVLALSDSRRPVIQDMWLDEDMRLRVHGLMHLAGLE
ncbi:MAG: tetratricopeptide repeat protein [Burkholderiales bacterium]